MAPEADGAAETPEIGIGPVHILHGQAERLDDEIIIDFDCLEMFEAGSVRHTSRYSASVPLRCPRAWPKSESAVSVTEVHLGGEGPGIPPRDARRPLDRKSTRSILLMAKHDVADAEQRGDESVARRVWVKMPWRASTSTMARSAVEAPVAMLRGILFVAEACPQR